MQKSKYRFEVLGIDPEDIRDEKSLAKALSFSAALWNNREAQEENKTNKWCVEENQSGIKVYIYPVDTSNVLTDYFDAAFSLKAECEDFDELESFRLRLLLHLKGTLKFKHIRILNDDISTYIANTLYPKINQVESMLRKYLVKFFIQRVGLDWWEATANKGMIEKVATRRSDRKDIFSNLVVSDVSLADFDDLGELIYKQSSGFNSPDKAVAKILTIASIEDLNEFKSELEGNYTKYFKEFFQDKSFEPKWKDLYKIRNKVAHQGTFYKNELDRGLELSESLKSIIKDAEAKIDELVFSVEEKVAIRATIEASITEQEKDAEEKDVSEIPGIKVVGKMNIEDTPYPSDYHGKFLVITEEELIYELKRVQEIEDKAYIGLKWFVATYLANKGYSIGLTFSLINILHDRNTVEIYKIDNKPYDITAVRLK